MNSSRVVLYAFMPMTIPTQVARPFVYQFTPDFIDSIKTQPSLEFAVSKGNLALSESAKKSILPDDTGVILNTVTLQSQWTFVLLIDTTPETHGTILVPGIRQISMGYFTDEPIDMAGNPNPMATMIFTHNSVTFIRPSRGPMTPVDGRVVYNTQDVDYASESINMLYDNKMLLGTPKEILEMSARAAQNGFMDYSALDISSMKAGDSIKAIDTADKAPKHLLSDILRSVDNGLDSTISEEPVLSKFSDPNDMYLPPNIRAMETTVANMPSGHVVDIQTGLDTTRPVTMAELCTKFPNVLIQPFRVNVQNGYGWDVAQQATYNSNGNLAPIMSIRNQLSYLCSTVIQAVCSQLGVTTVGFSYRWLDGDGFVAGKNEAYQLIAFNLAIPRPDCVTESAALRFKMTLDDQLFDVIHSLAGEFELHVMADMGGNILINLKLYNFPDAQDGAYYQTTARLGGMVNPLIGTVEIINNNVVQLNNAMQSLIATGLEQKNLELNTQIQPQTWDTGLPTAQF